jgi:agmatinase
MNFDPNAAASADSGVFGLPFTLKESKLAFLPIPWDATTSYRAGTHRGPELILEASRQVDLFDLSVEEPYAPGWFWLPVQSELPAWNSEARHLAEAIIERGGNIKGNATLEKALTRVNVLSDQVNQVVYRETKEQLDQGRIVAVVGGEHSVPFGAIQAIAERVGPIGILHFDAHSDTRNAYEGFTWSHASIMHNVLEKIPSVEKLVQVGIRDFCEEEYHYLQEQGQRVSVHYDKILAERKFRGEAWTAIATRIIAELPERVWISFDIDGLDPRFCPNTGTPVPGGLEFNEAIHLIETLARSGRKIVGFDLNEVAPSPSWPDQNADEWDGNVGARLLYKLATWTMASQGLVQLRNLE